MTVERLITDHIDTWTSALKTRSTAGRGSNGKIDLYGIKKLRELILELAVRGKLVPQDPNDEPASELLKRIASEKAELVKQGKIKKQKPLPEIGEDEKPFELPVGWEWVRLGEICEVKGGKRLPTGHSYAENVTPYVYIRVTDMKNGTIKNDDLCYINEETRNVISKYTISKRDLYITIAGTIGQVGLVPSRFDGMNLTENAAKICVFLTNRIWLKDIISSGFLKNQFLERANTLAQPKLALNQISESVLPLPPLQEQEHVISKINDLMSLCDQLEQQSLTSLDAHQQLVETLLSTLTDSQNAEELAENWARISQHFDTLFTTEASIDALKQTILQLAVMGKLVQQDPNDEPASELLKCIEQEKSQLVKEGKIKKQKPLPPVSNEEKPFELPEGWEWCRLETITELITKGSSPKWQGVSYTDNPNDVLFITSENVGSFKILLDSEKYVEKKFNEIEPRSILTRNDILMNIVGASIGRTAIFNMNRNANINQAVCLIRVINNSMLLSYLLNFFNSDICLSYMFDKQVDNARANLSMGNIAKFVLPIPPLNEQKRIVEHIDNLMSICDKLQSHLQSAQQTQLHLADALTDAALN
ncbi:restriction endonuclease subunit S [Serratia quinivorans]|uniref:restriction endonuclease subunit S n=1 Tax=Serratia quinivorans TaxID=137545 RepID=UPI002178FA36|nr:restriction endonuclease subunit S [Serratia quinivorans]CAI0913196.1 Type I restriction enzyme EcoKI specificity protein [Serratia quinivorans]